MPKKYSVVYKRHQARRLCVQALYQWSVNSADCREVLENVVQERAVDGYDVEYLEKCFLGVGADSEAIATVLKGGLDRDLQRLNPVESAILHLAVYEFMHCSDVPYKVIINEAVDLAKEFGAEDGYKYVNGVLDNLATTLRRPEVKSPGMNESDD